MTLSDTGILSAVELPIYLTLIPLVLYVTYKHGRHGILGFFYLNISCGVRVAADIVNLVQGNHSDGNPKKPNIAAIVIGSIGLTPLMLALAGMLHEIHYRLLLATRPGSNVSATNKRLWTAQFQIHGIVVAAMVLFIIGGIHIATAKPNTNISGDEKLRHAGAIILVLVWLGLVQYSGWLLYRCRQSLASLRPSILKFANWTLAAGVIIGIRVIYAVVYTFDPSDTSISPVTGSIAVKACLTVLVTLAAVLAMTFAGWTSRDAPMYRQSAFAQEQAQSGEDDPMMLTVHPNVK